MPIMRNKSTCPGVADEGLHEMRLDQSTNEKACDVTILKKLQEWDNNLGVSNWRRNTNN